MKLSVIAFTARGGALARRLAETFGGRAFGLGKGKIPGLEAADSLSQWTAQRWRESDGLIFVGACGIAVRAIAPHVKDKFTDPAVVSVDEGGQFAVPLLSGHVGGANELARQVADLTGGQAVISTATDVNGLFAVDAWAKEQQLAITDRTLAKEISSALLAGEPVGFYSDFGHPMPEGLGTEGELGVWVTARTGPGPFARTLRLVPRCLTVGVGCRRGTPEAAVAQAVQEALTGWEERAVACVATIDLKAHEPGLLAFCETMGWPLVTYSAAELAEVNGNFTPSAFVRSVTGVENVCERAAVRAAEGGRCVVPKQARDGVTAAVAERSKV
ncbi:cobalamin biosynthesis protein [Pseudoflavonifractor phocaeensis]|uniref:cobalamin biosynthesis protein n=1 Tax=Pseudoflavonifractor phocaeensis TaxID=1870988 RepID=UPI0019580C27|nr:cobalt-precorrin 5A hydrolase [Pseudoflavonifractor phocaeensis]